MQRTCWAHYPSSHQRQIAPKGPLAGEEQYGRQEGPGGEDLGTLSECKPSKSKALQDTLLFFVRVSQETHITSMLPLFRLFSTSPNDALGVSFASFTTSLAGAFFFVCVPSVEPESSRSRGYRFGAAA